MKLFHWLHSPLTGTAGVLAALGLLALPLRHLTSAPPAQPRRVAPAVPAAGAAIPAVLRLKLLAPARSVRLTSEAGKVVLDLTNVTAGESEHDALLPLHDGMIDLWLKSDLSDSPADTALFLTIMPDAYEGQTRYVIGSGTLDETLHYDWHAH